MGRSGDNPAVIPNPALRRLPAYLVCLQALKTCEERWVTCAYLSSQVKIESSLVRKDLAYTGLAGRQKMGYEVPALIEAIERLIGWDNSTDAFLVGVGNLGSAILGYMGFSQYGLNIVCGFDVDQAKIGTEVHGKAVLPLGKLPDLARRMHVSIGIITCGASAAQEVAELMLRGGIRAIWNFTQAHLQVAEDVIVENVDLAASLAVLSTRLSEADKALAEQNDAGEKGGGAEDEADFEADAAGGDEPAPGPDG